ncbi:hypothetical protein [Priestia megaterium]|uniref:hypothetical protein n=1 Tax=Priestia megaterium TaxID=1404 RepID=UPI001E52CB1C|nr:hypothetical protein [Priestia megaterium]
MRSIIAQTKQMQRTSNILATGVVGLGSAMTATSAVGVAAVGALGASFAAAGVGALAYGVVATSALTKVFDASEEVKKIQDKIDKADTLKERIKAQKELAALYKGMSTEQRGALKDLTEFKSFWGGFVKQFEKPVFKAFSEGLNATQTILTKLKPTISSVADAVVGLMQGFNQSLEGSAATKFFEWLETNAARSLTSFTQVATNTFSGVISLLQAFQPLGLSMEASLVRLSQRFSEWAASLSGTQGFKDFVAYVQTNGPKLWDSLKNIGNTIVNIATALAPFGSIVLTVVDNLTSFAEKITSSKEALIGIGAAIVTFRAGLATLTIIQTINTLLAAYRAGTLLATAAQLGFNVALLANPIGLVIVAISALVGIGVVLVRNWDTVKAKAQQLWSKFGSLITKILAFSGPIGALVAGGIKLCQNWDKVKAVGTAAFNAIGNVIDKVKGRFHAFTSAVSSFKMPNFKMPSIGDAKAGMGPSKSKSKKNKSSYHGESYVPRNGMMYRLHQGERVLTKKENRQFSKGTGGGVTINLNGTTIREDTDVDKLAASLARQIYLAGEAGA